MVSELGITYPVALDPGGAMILPQYGRGIGIPLTFVIGADRTIRHMQRNYQPGDEDALSRAIAEVLQGSR